MCSKGCELARTHTPKFSCTELCEPWGCLMITECAVCVWSSKILASVCPRTNRSGCSTIPLVELYSEQCAFDSGHACVRRLTVYVARRVLSLSLSAHERSAHIFASTKDKNNNRRRRRRQHAASPQAGWYPVDTRIVCMEFNGDA